MPAPIMKQRNLKLIILLTAFSLGGLLVTQMLWVRKAYQMSLLQFDHRANQALREVIDDMQMKAGGSPATCAMKMTRDSLASGPCILDVIDTAYLRMLLHKYVDFNRLDPHFQFGILRTTDDSVIYTSKAGTKFSGRKDVHKACLSCLCQSDLYHLAVIFPQKSKFIFLDLSAWLLSSLLFLLVVILSFAFVVLTFIRQKKLSEVRNDFMNNMTHEFKTPISTISVASEVLLNADPQTSVGRISKYARIIYDENQRMRNQVERVLQIAVLDKGEFQLKKTKVDIHELLKSTVQNLCFDQAGRNVEANFSLLANRFVVLADAMHLTNIFTNLVDNAKKYSVGEIKIDISTSNRMNGIEIVFSDNGIGMHQDTIKHIFDKFYRVPTGNIHNVKGFGLGLYYVKTMTEAHSGTVNVTSEPGKGSRFVIFLPFGDDQESS